MTPSPQCSTSVALIIAIVTILPLSGSSVMSPTSSAKLYCPAPANPKATMPERFPPAFARISPRRWRSKRTASAIAVDTPRGGSFSRLTSCWGAVTPDQAHRVASKLYPLSTIPILIQNYLWTRPEMCCPRGAAVGSILQTVAIFMGVPIVAVATKLTGLPFIQMDWLHGMEQMLMAVPVHIMAMSFRQTVLSHENRRTLPKSATRFAPMMKVASILNLLIFILACIHKLVGGKNWTSIRFLGGLIDPPGIDTERLKGGLSFATWIPHWTMFLDLITQTWYMSRWAECTGIRQWKALSLLHMPYVLVNAIVALNHFHRDGISGLKLLHPLFVFVGSLATLFGTAMVVSAGSNWGWRRGTTGNDDNSKCLLDGAESKAGAYPDWDPWYSAKSMMLSVFLSYASVYFSQDDSVG